MSSLTNTFSHPPGKYGPPGSGRSSDKNQPLRPSQSEIQQGAMRGPSGRSGHSRTDTDTSGNLANLVRNSDPIPHDHCSRSIQEREHTPGSITSHTRDEVFGTTSPTIDVQPYARSFTQRRGRPGGLFDIVEDQRQQAAARGDLRQSWIMSGALSTGALQGQRSSFPSTSQSLYGREDSAFLGTHTAPHKTLSESVLMGPGRQNQDLPHSAHNLETSVVLRDTNAAHQTIGKMQAEIEELRKDFARCQADRRTLRKTVANKESALKDISSKLIVAEKNNQTLTQENKRLKDQLTRLQVQPQQKMSSQKQEQIESRDLSASLSFQSLSSPMSPKRQTATSSQSRLSFTEDHTSQSTQPYPAIPRDLYTTSAPAQISPSSSSFPPRDRHPAAGLQRAVASSPHSQAITSGLSQHEFRDGFNTLFRSVEDWSRRFANTPNRQADLALPVATRALLREAADASLAEVLLGRVDTRWTFVTRAIVQYLMGQIHGYAVLRNSGKEVDEKVDACVNQLHPRMPYDQRKQVLEELAQIAGNLQLSPTHEESFARKVQVTSGELLEAVGHFQAPNARVAEARVGLEQVVREALHLGWAMYTSPAEWVVDFARQGSRFNSHAMINRDHHIVGNPRDLERRNFRVKLAITPTVVRRDVSGAALLVAALHHGHVLLMA